MRRWGKAVLWSSVLSCSLCACGVNVAAGEPPSIDSLIYDKTTVPVDKNVSLRAAEDLVNRLQALDVACNDSILHLYASTAQMYMGIKQPDGKVIWTCLDKSAYTVDVSTATIRHCYGTR